MICKKKELKITLFMFFIVCIGIYFLIMNPFTMWNNLSMFVERSNSVFSYYESRMYTFLIVPLYVIFCTGMYVSQPQKVIRIRNRKKIALKELIDNYFITLIYIMLNTIVGIIIPIIFNIDIFSNQFLLIYLLQMIYMYLFFVILGNIILIAKAFNYCKRIRILIPLLFVFLNYIFRHNTYYFLWECNLIIPFFRYGKIDNLLETSIVLFALLIGTSIIKIYASSEEEYWDEKQDY